MKTESLVYIITALEFIAAVVAIACFKKYKNSSERYFLYFLWFTFLVEAIGASIGNNFPTAKVWLYNIFSLISFTYYFYWYYSIFVIRFLRKTVVFFASLFIVVTLATYLFPDSLGIKGYAFVTGSICLLILTLFHFYQLLNSNEVLIIKHKLSFWISTGLLLFYVGIIPLVLLSNYLVITPLSNIIILVSLNVILYGCYIIGFLWTKKKYNRW